MLSYKLKKLNQKGVGILQVMIMSGLIGILAVAFLQLTDRQNKSLETTKAFSDLAQFTDQVRMSLSDPQACLATFGSQPYASPYNVTTLNKTYVQPTTQVKVTTALASVGDEIAPNLKLTQIRMKSVNIITQKAFIEITVERKGGVISKREIQMVALDPASTGQITNCFTSGTSIEDPALLCESLGGAWNSTDKRCNGIVAVDPNPVFCSKYAKRQLTQDSTGRLKIVCESCPSAGVDKFHHWACEHYPGKSSYSNMCYYTRVCPGTTDVVMRPALWNGSKGPTSASGGDNSNASGCRSDRRPCAGEPPGMAEHQVNP